jgi:protocatechuate 3,4-dioxygenase beta subunit
MKILRFSSWFPSITLAFVLSTFFAYAAVLSKPSTHSVPARPTGAPAKVGLVHGTVRDAEGTAIPAALVTLTFETGQVKTVRTKSDGSFAFRGVIPGTYMVSASSPDLQPVTVRLLNVEPGQRATADVLVNSRQTSHSQSEQ